MEQPARFGVNTTRRESIASVPTARGVVVRTVPAAVVMVAGLPLLVWWVLVENGGARSEWGPLVVGLFCAIVLIVQRLCRAPRPRIDRDADRGAVKRRMVITATGGRLPDDARMRVHAGVLACEQIESAVLAFAGAVGMGIVWVMQSEWLWLMLAVVLTVQGLVMTPRARRGWGYLRKLHVEASDPAMAEIPARISTRDTIEAGAEDVRSFIKDDHRP